MQIHGDLPDHSHSNLKSHIFIPVHVPAHGDQDPHIAIFWVITSFSLVGQSHSFVQNNNV